MSSHVSFSLHDLSPVIPAPGYYHCAITQAGFRSSSRGNRMLAFTAGGTRKPLTVSGPASVGIKDLLETDRKRETVAEEPCT